MLEFFYKKKLFIFDDFKNKDVNLTTNEEINNRSHLLHLNPLQLKYKKMATLKFFFFV